MLGPGVRTISSAAPANSRSSLEGTMNVLPASAHWRLPVRIPDDLPQLLVRSLEITRVAAPERRAGRLDESGAGGLGLRHHVIGLLFRGNVMPQRRTGRARA